MALKRQMDRHVLKYVVVLFLGEMRASIGNILGIDRKFSEQERVVRRERSQFFRTFLRHWLGIEPITNVTCLAVGFLEGAGSRALKSMMAINFARTFGLTYVHTPFRHVAYPERPLADWVLAWEHYFNLGQGESTSPKPGGSTINFDYIHCFNLLWLFGIDESWSQLEFSPAFIADIKHKFQSGASSSTRRHDHFDVVIHTRRGEVNADDFPEMWVELSSIRQAFDSITATLNMRGIPFRVRLFSVGKPEDFSLFDGCGADLHLNVDALETMDAMVHADLLLMSKGCFSYVAGLLCDGIKIREDFIFTPDDPAWILCDGQGNFPQQKLMNLLPSS